MPNIFDATTHSPYHLSVGVVVVNAEGKIGVHHVPDQTGNPAHVKLLRETVEPGEPLEQAVARGLREEFGATGAIMTFLGSQITPFTDAFRADRIGATIEKTTLYFLVRLGEIDEQRRDADDPENYGAVEWHSPSDLIAHMRDQGKRLPDIDESAIVERAVRFIAD